MCRKVRGPRSGLARSGNRALAANVQALLYALMAASACEEEPTTEPEPEVTQTPAAIVVTPVRVVFAVIGDTVRLTAVVQDQNGEEISDATVQWSSADAAVATVANSGMVTARGFGETNVAARYENLETLVPVRVIVQYGRETLTAIYDATDGPNWVNQTNWLSNRPLGEWWGLDVNTQGHVVKLGLFENGLKGGIPPEIGDLRYVSHLYLDENGLSGPIPREIAGALGLSVLTVSNNPLLSGLLPREILDLWLLGFDYGGTSLCAPRSEAFTQWSRSIEDYTAESCSPTRHDELVLTELYHLLGGPDWSRQEGWLDAVPVDQWEGVAVDSAGRVAGLDLSNNGVMGELPHQLGYLDALKRLDLSDNSGLGGALAEWIMGLSLDSLDVSASGLCVPPSDQFDGWLTGLVAWSGAICTGPDSIRASVPLAYLTQATQNRDAGVPLIAGRDALLRVYPVADEVNYFDSEVRATFHRDGEVVHSVTMEVDGQRGIGTEVDESRLDRSHNALVPGSVLVPGLELVVELDPGGELPLRDGSRRRMPDSGTLALDVRELPVMKLTIVPVKIAGQSDSAVVAAAESLTHDSPLLKEFRTMIPAGEVDFSVRETLTVDAGDWGRRALEILEGVRQSDGAGGYYLGICDCRGGAAALGGWVSRSELRGTVMAHEIGHNLSLLHAPCGSPAGFVDDEYPYPGGRTGTWGYDAESGDLKPPRLADLMSYCEPPWLGDYGYVKALEHRLSVEAAAAGDASGYDERTSVLLLWGRAGPDEVALAPAAILNAVPSLPDGGPYRITGRARGGQNLFSLDFAPMVEAESGGGHFVITLPLDPAWAGPPESIVLSGPGGADTLDAATHRPMAIVTDRSTGRIRRILRDFEELPEVASDEEVTVSYGIPGTASRGHR